MIVDGEIVCNWADDKERPCWGEVLFCHDLGTEGYMHACEGHADMWNGIYYPKPSDAAPR